MGGPLRASILPRLAGQSAPKIIAYHGSPHSFDRFDASKIGTGEGGQAYGHGLYFAGAEDTADTYRRSLTALRRTPKEDALEFWRRHVERTDNPRNAVQYAIDDAEESLAEAAGVPGAEDRWREIVQHLYALDYRQPVPKRPGHMYEVELGVPEEALLDLDAPVLQQSQEIIAALGPYAEAPRHFTFGQDGWRGKNAYMAAAPVGFGDAMRQASRRLMKGGIPGLRYLDGNSRTAGQGTHNYVMFPGTEDRIRILRKFGLLAPMALPALQEDE